MANKTSLTAVCDQAILDEAWSDLTAFQSPPSINQDRLHSYRRARLRSEMQKRDIALCVMVNPISLRYAANYRCYQLFQSHIPSTYLFFPQEGATILYGAYGQAEFVDEIRPARGISVFDGGSDLDEQARLFALDVKDYLQEIGSSSRRVALEYVNPSLTQALLQQGLEVLDAVSVSEMARVIKSQDEVEAIKWAVAVAQHGIAKIKEVLRPGVSEQQLWGLLNYTNLCNDGDWHEGRMLASGPRTNPWCQEASGRIIQAGELVGFDTDMVGPFGYFADVSRTFHCGPTAPRPDQKRLYQLAVEEISHNLELVKPGISFVEFQEKSFLPPEEFHANAYTCILHAVGMCDEYPRINPKFRGATPYDGLIEAGMVLCIESFMGSDRGGEGVKLEQQVLVTQDGYELLSTYPLEEKLLH